jgi:hypothetical protein
MLKKTLQKTTMRAQPRLKKLVILISSALSMLAVSGLAFSAFVDVGTYGAQVITTGTSIANNMKATVDQFNSLNKFLGSSFDTLKDTFTDDLKKASVQSDESIAAVKSGAANVRNNSYSASSINGVIPKEVLDASQQELGKVGSARTASDIDTLQQKFESPTAAIVHQTKLSLELRDRDSINVVSFFDQQVGGNFQCRTQPKCTILMALQENNASHIDNLQKQTVDRGQYWLQQKQKSGSIADNFYDNVWMFGLKKDINKAPTAVMSEFSKFLSPAPMIPVAFSHDEARGSLTVEQSSVLADVLLGMNEMMAITDYAESTDANARENQARIMTRFARAQLARAAMVAITSRELSDSMNSEFRACVVRPNQTDSLSATVQQHLVNIQYLMRCNNLSLLHMRRIQMEQSRLLATMLATMLDQMSNTDLGDGGVTTKTETQ